MSESLFDKITGLYPATSLKERTPTQVFSDEFREILKTPFYRTPSSDYFCSAEIYFANKIVKNPLRKEKKMETTCKKNNDTRKTKP